MSWSLGSNIEWALGAVALKSTNPTAVKMRKFTAVAYEGGVFLRWHTHFEVDNLGWDVYREVDGEPVKITPGRLAGTMFMFGQGTRLTSGYSYSWWDPAGLITDRYWIDDVDLNGTKTRHGPIIPQEPEEKNFIHKSRKPEAKRLAELRRLRTQRYG